MKFFREHSGLILKLFANQIGITFFALVLTMAVIQMKNDSLKVVVSLFSIVFYLCLIYSVMWQAGASDIIAIEHGHRPKISLYPVKVALYASVPNLLLGVLLVITCLLGPYAGLSGASAIFAVLHIIAGLFEAMYVGLFSFIIEPLSGNSYYLVVSLLYVLSSLPLVLMSAAAYALGTRNFGARVKNNNRE